MSFSVYANIQFDRQQEIQRGITQYFCPTYRGVEEEEQYEEEDNIFYPSYQDKDSFQQKIYQKKEQSLKDIYLKISGRK